MKTILNILLLGTILVVGASIAGDPQSATQHRTDRYTVYQTGATIEELNPLAVFTQIHFPSQIKTVQAAIDYALERSGYRVDWQHSRTAKQILSELKLPAVHRRLHLMTVRDVVETLAGKVWQVSEDTVHRLLNIELREPQQIRQSVPEVWQTSSNPPSMSRLDEAQQPARNDWHAPAGNYSEVHSEPFAHRENQHTLAVGRSATVGSLDEIVTVHRSSITVKELIELLLPAGWTVHYEVSDMVLNQNLTSHAESSRRHALLALFKEINLKALFYPRDAVVLVIEKDYPSYQRDLAWERMRSQALHSPKQSQATTSALPVQELVEDAKAIKDLMNEMEADLK